MKIEYRRWTRTLMCLAIVGIGFSKSTALAQTTFDDALETSNLDWASNGLWQRQTGVTSDGVDALASSPIGNNESAILQLTIQGPVHGTFRWKVSSEQGFDFLYLVNGNQLLAEISGEVDWQEVSLELGAGTHTLQWNYEKDESTAAGQDRGWLDQFSFGGQTTPLRITQQPVGQSVTEGDSVTLSVGAEGSGNLSYQWFKGNTPINGATANTLTFNPVALGDAGNYTVVVADNSGQAQSQTVALNVARKSSETWTILVYGHADHNLSVSLVADMLEMEQAGSSEGFNIVLQTDFNTSDRRFVNYANQVGVDSRYQTDVTRYLVGPDTDNNPNTFNSPPVGLLSEDFNMDSPDTLKDFLNWGISTYPATRYGVIHWNHGGQWVGFGGDKQNGTLKSGNLFTTKVIRDVMREVMQARSITKFDFVAFDTCLMAGAEVLVDFADLAELFIANAELDYGDGLDYGGELKILKNNPGIDIFQFGREEVPVWNAHHNTQVDNALKVHATYDLSKYAAFSQILNTFATELRAWNQSRSAVIAQLRRQTTHYSISSISEINKPTDYIDLGEFANKIAANTSSPTALRSAASALTPAIDAMTLGLATGTLRQGKVHGLSIYYPVNGVSQQDTYSNLAFNALPNAAWQGFLRDVAQTSAGNRVGPSMRVGTSSSARRAGNDRSSDFVYVASLEDPASLVFNVEEDSDDAYGFYSALVSNEETGDPFEFIYLGEIANGLADGPGEYELFWDTTMPTLTAEIGDAMPYLGGWFQSPDSNLMFSYADYLAPGETEPVEVILITELGEESGTVIQVMDSATDNLSAVAGIELEPDGKLTPLYYTERREGTYEEWEFYDVFFEDFFVTVPENGMAGLSVEYIPVFLGDYTVEIVTTDVFDNVSEPLTFPVVALEDINDFNSGAVRLALSRVDAGTIQVSWERDALLPMKLQTAPSVTGPWTDVTDDVAVIEETETTATATISLDPSALFFRLVSAQ